jgi:hypothetical protein
MDERDELASSGERPLAAEVGERVTGVLRAAEEAASAMRHDAEQQIQAKRRAAEEEILRHTEEKRREADELLESRLRRVSEIGDDLIARGDALLEQLSGAQELKDRLQAAVSALAEAADALAREMSSPGRPSLSVVRDEGRETGEAERAAHPEAEAGEAPAQPTRERERPEMSPLERLKAAGSRPAEDDAAERRGRYPTTPSEGAPTPADDRLLGARLVALQMAVAGSTREEVDAHLRSEFELEDPSTILDEVFGRATSQG